MSPEVITLCTRWVQSETWLCVWCLSAELDVAASRPKFRWRVFHKLPPEEEQAVISASGGILAEFIKYFNSPFISSATIGLLIGGSICTNDSMGEFYGAIHLPGATCWRQINVVIERWVRANNVFLVSPCTQTNTLKLIRLGLFWSNHQNSTLCLTHGSVSHEGCPLSSAQLTSQSEFV